MYLAKRGGGLVTSATSASSIAQYSHTAGELSAAAPSHAAWLAPAVGSSGLALSLEPGTHIGCNACRTPTELTDERCIFGRCVFADSKAAGLTCTVSAARRCTCTFNSKGIMVWLGNCSCVLNILLQVKNTCQHVISCTAQIQACPSGSHASVPAPCIRTAVHFTVLEIAPVYTHTQGPDM